MLQTQSWWARRGQSSSPGLSLLETAHVWQGQALSSSPTISPCPAAQTNCPTADMTDCKGIPELPRAITCCQTHGSAETARTRIGLGLGCVSAPPKPTPAGQQHLSYAVKASQVSSVGFPGSSKYREERKNKPKWKIHALLLANQLTNYSSSRLAKVGMLCNSLIPSIGASRNWVHYKTGNNSDKLCQNYWSFPGCHSMTGIGRPWVRQHVPSGCWQWVVCLAQSLQFRALS